jgi:hypothetical protein
VFTELFFPLGLRYHALHHLFPALPYHNLGIAHRRLLRELSENSAYRATVYSSFWDVVGVLWSDMRQAARGGNRSADVWFRRRREILATTEDHSLIPEIAWERPDGVDVFGFGMRFLLKTGPQTYGEVLGVYNWSDDPRFRREGIFLSHNFLF